MKLKILKIKRHPFSVFSTADGFKFVENPIVDVVFSGKKKLLRVNTKLGKSITCSEDHKFQTIKKGLVPLKHILKKEEIFFTSSDNAKIIETDKVATIENIGEKDSYDLSLKKDPHNFFCNGICVSNSHAISYGTVSYLMMYIKTHYPIYFYCIQLEISGEDDYKKIIEEALRDGIKISLVDINYSKEKFTVLGNEIIWSIKGIKGIGPAAVYGIIRNQPFNTLDEFFDKLSEMKCTKATVYALIRENAFGRTFGTKSEILNHYLHYRDELPFDTDEELEEAIREYTERKQKENKWNATAQKRVETIRRKNQEHKEEYEKLKKEVLVDGEIEKFYKYADMVSKFKNTSDIRKNSKELNEIRKYYPTVKWKITDLSDISEDVLLRDKNRVELIAFLRAEKVERSEEDLAKKKKPYYRIHTEDETGKLLPTPTMFMDEYERYGEILKTNTENGRPLRIILLKNGKWWNVSLITPAKTSKEIKFNA